MLERIAAGDYPQRPHTALRGPSIEGIVGALRWEECITRRGFDGPYTIVYHLNRPHEGQPVDDAPVLAKLEAATSDAPALLRRHYRSAEVRSTGSALSAKRPLLFNEDVVLSVLRPTESEPGGEAGVDPVEHRHVLPQRVVGIDAQVLAGVRCHRAIMSAAR